jgi:hypothetical protein
MFTNAPPDAPETDFLDYPKFQIENCGVPPVPEDWVAALDKLGINPRLRDAIVHPDYEDIRSTASCQFWVMEAVQIAFETLEGLDNNLRMEAARRQHARNMETGDGFVGTKSPPPSSAAPVSQKQISQQSNITYSDTQGGSVPQSASLVEAPRRLEGHTMIWRACSKDRAARFCNANGHSLDERPMVMAPGDFSGVQYLVYWTPQRETAYRYAGWLKHKIPIAEICILQVACPESLMTNLEVQYLWADGPEVQSTLWKQVIWYSRNGRRLPQELRHRLARAIWIGHIATDTGKKFAAMASWREVRESNALTVDIDNTRRKAIQWVFQTDEAQVQFETVCHGKTWVHSVGKMVDGNEK